MTCSSRQYGGKLILRFSVLFTGPRAGSQVPALPPPHTASPGPNPAPRPGFPPGPAHHPRLRPTPPAWGLPTGVTNRSQPLERWWKWGVERLFSARICLPALSPPAGPGSPRPAMREPRSHGRGCGTGTPGPPPEPLLRRFSPPFLLSLRRLLNSRPPAAKGAGALRARENTPGVYQGAASLRSPKKSPVMTLTAKPLKFI